ncbi:MAG: 7,8-didemethyl-8-hydroxy-5-deazariboflavin synthase subunit CofG [Dehalococcoidia bacterium]|nr:7,8-didemethyl-8-hydroxy-5-deazariboflavin synthase subunit CofG [Dehalococcoidia bacterium]
MPAEKHLAVSTIGIHSGITTPARDRNSGTPRPSIARSEALALMGATGAELVGLLHAAADLRERHKGRVATYSRKVFIPLTNLCRDKCGYCTFAKQPTHPGAGFLTPDQVLDIARAGQQQGCKEALFTLGDHPELRHSQARDQLQRFGHDSTIGYLAEMCGLVLRETGLLPHVNCGLLNTGELLELREVCASIGLMLESSSTRLLERGQAHHGCVTKAPQLRVETIAAAAGLGIACTSGVLIGIGETAEERVEALFLLRSVQEEHGNLQEVIVQNFRAKPDIRMRNWSDPTTLDMVRTLAIARLVLGGAQNIQAPPNLAPDAYQWYLLAGINDWGGVSPVTIDHVNPEREWPEITALRAATAEAGYELRERLCLYPEYVRRPEFVRSGIGSRIDAWTDPTGLVALKETQ